MNDVCSVELLANAVANRLTADEEAALYDHLEHCESCCARMEQLAGGEQWQQEAASLLATDELDAAVPEPMVWSEVDFSVEHLDPSEDVNVLGQLGGYDVLAIIGRGGMGVVLKAFDRELKRYVAIKALSPHLAHSSVARKRFAREAQAAAAVVNPHVIAIHHVQPTGRLPFLIMPLLTGESLAQRLKSRAPLELTEVLRIGMQAAVGLAAAHDQGLVHRDVKPANIFLEKGVERVVITDFGLARAADDVSMTRLGVVAGTPEYMSPEQARGEALDGRSDLFSLGCVLYEMATGVSPFRSDSTIATLRRIVDDRPAAIASLAPELPPWFSYIVERLLSKDPTHRFASASEVSQLLEACLSHLQQPTSVPLPASLVSHAKGSRPIFNSNKKGIFTMLGTLGTALLGMVLWQGTEAPDISGQWTSDEWGTVVLESKGAGEYDGTFRGSVGSSSKGDGSVGRGGVTTPGVGGGVIRGSTGPRTGTGKSGTLRLKWSRLERRFNGTWRTGESAWGFFRKGTTENQGNSSVAMDVMPEDGVLRLRGSRNDVENAADFLTKGTKENQGNEKTPAVIQNSLPEDGVLPLKGSRNDVMNRNGKMSLRLVDKEIRGGFTTHEEAQLESGTPLLGDLLWTRNQEKPATEKASDRKNITATELEKQIHLAGRELFYGRMEVTQEFNAHWLTKENNRENITSTGTARWLKKGGLTRIESQRFVLGKGTTELKPEQWTTGQDGKQSYAWDRTAGTICYGALRPGSLAYAPNLFFWGRSGIVFPQPMFGPNPTITTVARDGHNEIDVDVVDAPSKSAVRYVGIAPSRGYLPTRVETRMGHRLISQVDLQDFFEPRPGVWAARTIMWTAWSDDDDVDGKPILASRTKFTVTRLELGDDARLQDEDFSLKLPDNVKVVDTAYTSDSQKPCPCPFCEIESKTMRQEIKANEAWSSDLPASEELDAYVAAIRTLPDSPTERFKFYWNHLEHKNEKIAEDSSREVAFALHEHWIDSATSFNIKEFIDRKKLVGWIKDSKVPRDRQKIYLGLLGICGDSDDIDMLKQMIENRTTAIILEAQIVAYISLAGPAAWDFVEQEILQDPAAPETSVYAVITAITFLDTHSKVIARDRLLQSLHLLLDHPSLADIVVRELIRMEDWSQVGTLVDLLKSADEDSMRLRIPIVRYLQACPLAEAADELKKLREIAKALEREPQQKK